MESRKFKSQAIEISIYLSDYRIYAIIIIEKRKEALHSLFQIIKKGDEIPICMIQITNYGYPMS